MSVPAARGERARGSFATVAAFVCATAAAQSIPIDADDIAGTVRSTSGPEAGVWVIAETRDLAIRYAKIVVTDNRGRYLIPDLPKASYKVWVRGYGLIDSAAKASSAPGQRVDITATLAPDAAAAARVYPAAYWFAMMRLPSESELEPLEGHRNAYLTWVKNMGCVGCHQLGQLSTRTLPPNLGQFATSEEAWTRRLSAGQAGTNMIDIAAGRLLGLPIKYFADWSDRIARGELPASLPQRPRGLERNVVATVRDWSDPKAYLHDLSGTDRRNPTVNGYGPLFGAPELSTDEFPILDPRKNVATTFRAPVRDADTPSTQADPVAMPSPYWGNERIWNSKANAHNPMLDARGRVWYTARIRAPATPAFCQKGNSSTHPSAQVFELRRSGRQLAIYEPATQKYTFIDTCFGTHHLQFDANDVLWTSGGGQVVGWLDAKKYLKTGDAAASQGWSPHVLDTNGNGRRDADWVEPGQPADPKRDTRIPVGLYAVTPNPKDGSIWGSVAFQYPGALLRFDPRTQLTEIFEPPLPGFGIRGADIDTDGVVWASLGSGHLGSFDRRKCKAALNGPNATGKHCPEGWTFHNLPGPGFRELPQFSVESSYYTWVDQFDTLGLGRNVPIATGNLFDGVHALVKEQMVTLRIPYPLGFYAKGMERRIDDAGAGWKGRGLWVTSGDRTPWLAETGKGTRPLVVHFQVRPTPLAK